jgi:hypothetical protein
MTEPIIRASDVALPSATDTSREEAKRRKIRERASSAAIQNRALKAAADRERQALLRQQQDLKAEFYRREAARKGTA